MERSAAPLAARPPLSRVHRPSIRAAPAGDCASAVTSVASRAMNPTARRIRFAAALAFLACVTRTAPASPLQFVVPGDPVEAELRVLDLYAPGPERGGLKLPHLDAAPWQVIELLPDSAAAAATGRVAGPRGIAGRRIARALERDASVLGSAGRSTPRAFEGAWPDGTRAELSLGLEGERDVVRQDGANSSRFVDGSGVHARAALQADRWLAYSHLWFGELRGVRAYSDALVANSDIAASTDESSLSYSAPAWSAQLGHGRWSWGPGEEGSLMLSRTMPAVNGLMLHMRLAPLHADAFIFDATVEPGTGEQLAAHRLEWQPRDGVRLGLSESARYKAGGWQGVYLAGVIPYSVAQRLLDREHADSTGVLRNNVMLAADASVRVADGSRAYAEILIDDLHARAADVPNKYGGQAGWSGTGTVDGTRLTWDAEYTWLSRYVYTSFFGRSYVAQGQPLGFFTGPDARRLRARVTLDPDTDWQLALVASRTDHGSEGLNDPFVPGGPVPDVNQLAGTVERTRSLTASTRWWPASGVDLSLSAGRQWVDDAGNVAGAQTNAWTGSFAFRITR